MRSPRASSSCACARRQAADGTDQAIPIKITAIPIDFDREHPERKQFGKLIYRGGLNLFANSSFFGGYSEMALDPTGTTLLAVSDAGTWLRADSRL